MDIDKIIPNIGLGTYMMSPEEAEQMTYESIKVGYRHIDTAEVYRNEKGVGEGIKKAIAEDIIKRSDLFVTTKDMSATNKSITKNLSFDFLTLQVTSKLPVSLNISISIRLTLFFES